jgi:hypothetical protein
MIRFGTRIGARVVFGLAETERRTGKTRVWVRCDCGSVAGGSGQRKGRPGRGGR